MKVFGKSRILQDLFHLGKLKETWSSRITSQHGCSYFVGLLQVARHVILKQQKLGTF